MLRHAGVLVKNLEEAVKTYQKIGFHPLQPIEILRVMKMTDSTGAMIELVEGNWHEHLAINWYDDGQGNYIEFVKGD